MPPDDAATDHESIAADDDEAWCGAFLRYATSWRARGAGAGDARCGSEPGPARCGDGAALHAVLSGYVAAALSRWRGEARQLGGTGSSNGR